MKNIFQSSTGFCIISNLIKHVKDQRSFLRSTLNQTDFIKGNSVLEKVDYIIILFSQLDVYSLVKEKEERHDQNYCWFLPFNVNSSAT